jgi:chromosome segregation ATPase
LKQDARNGNGRQDLKTEEIAAKLNNALEKLAIAEKTVISLREQINSMTELQKKIKTDASNTEKALRDSNTNLNAMVSQLQAKIDALTPKPVSQIEVAGTDLLDRMIQIGHDQKISMMPKVVEEIARVEKVAGIKVR